MSGKQNYYCCSSCRAEFAINLWHEIFVWKTLTNTVWNKTVWDSMLNELWNTICSYKALLHVLIIYIPWFLVSSLFYKVLHFAFHYQEEKDEIKAVWNNHPIHPFKDLSVPSVILEVMYTVPQLWASEDFMVPHNDLYNCKQACTFISVVSSDIDLFDLCNTVMSESKLTFAKNISEAQEFYLTIKKVCAIVFKFSTRLTLCFNV